jgi:transcriptional regulator with XRE-family HTH domain
LLNNAYIALKMIELRTKHQWSQEQLAQKLFVSHQAVSRWENQKSLPSIDTLCLMTTLYHVSIEELLCLDQCTEPVSLMDSLKTSSEEEIIQIIHAYAQRVDELFTHFHLFCDNHRKIILFQIIRRNPSFDFDRQWHLLSEQERLWLLRKNQQKEVYLHPNILRTRLSNQEQQILRKTR